MTDTDLLLEIRFFGNVAKNEPMVYRCTRINTQKSVDEVVNGLVEALRNAARRLDILEPDRSYKMTTCLFFRAYVAHTTSLEIQEHKILEFVHQHGFHAQPRL